MFDWLSLDWQMIAVFVIVLAAVVHLVRVSWRALAGRGGGCGSCSSGGCDPESLGQKKPLVSIDLPSADPPAASKNGDEV